MTEEKRRFLKRRLQESRYRLITRATKLAAPLVPMIFVAVSGTYRMSTNGSCIYFDPTWLGKLDDWSLDYALCHQLMHLKLGHLQRSRLFKGDRYHYACNIIVNDCLVEYGFTEDKLPGIGELTRRTPFPKVFGRDLTPIQAYHNCPFDPSELTPSQRARLMSDTDVWWDSPDDRGDTGVIVLGPNDPDPKDLIPSEKIIGEVEFILKSPPHLLMPNQNLELVDKELEDLDDFSTEYITHPRQNLKETVADLKGIKSRDEQELGGSAFVERVIRSVDIIPKDWRRILQHFIMDETMDYDFSPPDKRMQELDFFLPDFCESHTPRLNVLFMIDISASLRDNEVSMAMTELNAAMEQFAGMLEGNVGFFDTIVRQITPLSKIGNAFQLVPKVSGGTDFGCIFEYIRKNMAQKLPSEIVIMTDGRSDFPDYSETMGIPVLWLLTSNRVRVPWGKVACFRRA